jgi:uncharacterized membrane protein YgcG
MNKQILDKSFKPYLTQSNLAEAIERIANQINQDYSEDRKSVV